MVAYNRRALLEQDGEEKEVLEGEKWYAAGCNRPGTRALEKLEQHALGSDLLNIFDAHRTPLTSCDRIQSCGDEIVVGDIFELSLVLRHFFLSLPDPEDAMPRKRESNRLRVC